VVTNPFSQLTKEAALDTVCAEAGKEFAARKANNPRVDFNTEVWFLAGAAVEADLSALKSMAREEVAKAIGDSISRWINSAKIVSAFEHKRFHAELLPVMPRFVVRLLGDPKFGTWRFCDERGKGSYSARSGARGGVILSGVAT
jgi:hypothetical protein